MAYIQARVAQWPDLCVISARHRGILAVMKDKHLGWSPGCPHHSFSVRHLASNFHSRFRDKSLKMLPVHASKSDSLVGSTIIWSELPGYTMNPYAWLGSIPLEKWGLTHDEGDITR